MGEPRARRNWTGLRTRTSFAFAALALLLSTTLALTTYELSRRYLLARRESLATQEAFLNARAVARFLDAPNTDPAAVLGAVSNAGDARAVMQLGGKWYSASVDVGRVTIPAKLQTLTGTRAARQLVSVGGSPAVVVAVPIGPGIGVYYEVFPLTELQATLRTLGIVLAVMAVLTTLLGALLGRLASRRVLRPLEKMSETAASIAHGDRESRLSATDPDLAPFIHSFNTMVDAMQARIDREERFASDVSHELRTPLTAIQAAIDVLDRRVDDQTRPALEVLRRQTYRFEHLVLDLLEISRLDAGAATPLALEPVAPAELVEETLRRERHPEVPVEIDASAPATARLDRRRVERVLTNLIDNADHYAGGATRVRIAGTPDCLEIAVDDAGPGVAPSERELVFERFHRGDTSRATTAPGTGLGLAIAAEHCRLHGGRLTVGDSPDGGARFLIELPVGAQ